VESHFIKMLEVRMQQKLRNDRGSRRRRWRLMLIQPPLHRDTFRSLEIRAIREMRGCNEGLMDVSTL